MSKLIDLTGRRFGILTVLSKAPSRRNSTMWNVRCDCGKEGEAYASHLRNGATKSCGCRMVGKGSENSGWNGYGRISGQKWATIVGRYKYRKCRSFHGFDITIEYAWELYEKQGGRCILTGLPIEFGERNSDPSTASLDRIDAKVGYVVGNVQWVHKDINRMKNIYGQDYFIEMCRRVADHAGEKK